MVVAAVSWGWLVAAGVCLVLMLGMGLQPGWESAVPGMADIAASDGPQRRDCSAYSARATGEDWPLTSIPAPANGWTGAPLAVVVWGAPNIQMLASHGRRSACGALVDSQLRDTRFNAGIGGILVPQSGSMEAIEVRVSPSISTLWPTSIRVGDPAVLQRADGLRWMFRVGMLAVALVLIASTALAFAAAQPRTLLTFIAATLVFAAWVAEVTGIAGYPMRWLAPASWQPVLLVALPLPIVAAVTRGLLIQSDSQQHWPELYPVTLRLVVLGVLAVPLIAILPPAWLPFAAVAIEAATLVIMLGLLACAAARWRSGREALVMVVSVLPFIAVIAGSLARAPWLEGWKIEALVAAGTWLALVAHLLAARRMARVNRDLRAMRELASTDELTGIPNRRAALRKLALARELAEGQGTVLALAVIDLDRFKQINDDHGHGFGDDALVHFTTVARSCIRRSDVIGRLGGEEFVLLLSDASLTEAERILTTIRSRLREKGRIRDHDVVLDFSAGLTDVMAHVSVEKAIDAADRALYRAKDGGRGRTERVGLG